MICFNGAALNVALRVIRFLEGPRRNAATLRPFESKESSDSWAAARGVSLPWAGERRSRGEKENREERRGEERTGEGREAEEGSEEVRRRKGEEEEEDDEKEGEERCSKHRSPTLGRRHARTCAVAPCARRDTKPRSRSPKGSCDHEGLPSGPTVVARVSARMRLNRLLGDALFARNNPTRTMHENTRCKAGQGPLSAYPCRAGM